MWLIKHSDPEPIAEEYSPDNLTPHQLSQQLARDLEDVERLFNMTRYGWETSEAVLFHQRRTAAAVPIAVPRRNPATVSAAVIPI